jgi:sortase A
MGFAVRQVIHTTGEIALTAGAIGLLFIGYLVWGTSLRAASAQRQLGSELNQQWQQAPAHGDAIEAGPEQFHLSTGEPFAFITIPAFGPHWRFTLIQGTAMAQLDVSPGHVPGTQWPGQVDRGPGEDGVPQDRRHRQDDQGHRRRPGRDVAGQPVP